MSFIHFVLFSLRGMGILSFISHFPMMLEVI